MECEAQRLHSSLDEQARSISLMKDELAKAVDQLESRKAENEKLCSRVADDETLLSRLREENHGMRQKMQTQEDTLEVVKG